MWRFVKKAWTTDWRELQADAVLKTPTKRLAIYSKYRKQQRKQVQERRKAMEEKEKLARLECPEHGSTTPTLPSIHPLYGRVAQSPKEATMAANGNKLCGCCGTVLQGNAKFPETWAEQSSTHVYTQMALRKMNLAEKVYPTAAPNILSPSQQKNMANRLSVSHRKELLVKVEADMYPDYFKKHKLTTEEHQTMIARIEDHEARRAANAETSAETYQWHPRPAPLLERKKWDELASRLAVPVRKPD
eukprot:TRINITY_DN31230_c0_g2_i1.p1 TRINITY_DN31230_c0_g2~~TRINITY_DN31230_c0_g2_i1.p1  ORF type:complete len:271 (-),score=22.48 TRINITY_DN31230_c0_g2_i1:29-766(-)